MRGYDFRGYARGSLKRRILSRVRQEGLRSISGLQERAIHDGLCMDRLLLDLSVNVTAMFRDPGFYLSFRRNVIPILRTYPFIRLWNAGCSTGEEAYSFAILLKEEGLYDRARIYATDSNELVLQEARTGRFSLKNMREYTSNYIAGGGRRAFSEYYSTEGTTATLDPSLRSNIVFAPHNLVTDRSFNEFNAIVCRNVMIYFARPLQNRVHDLFHASLSPFGVLALGRKESIMFTEWADTYEEIDTAERIYRKVR
ncbi:MAG: protein-glutamate O-methyltransferase CheR [Actinomycetota bacterium]|nr:protein-glutamate O-methyltransferase CheR [Actinomycetota bacterium]